MIVTLASELFACVRSFEMSDRMTEREIIVSDMHDKTKVSGLPALWLDGQPETLQFFGDTLPVSL